MQVGIASLGTLLLEAVHAAELLQQMTHIPMSEEAELAVETAAATAAASQSSPTQPAAAASQLGPTPPAAAASQSSSPPLIGVTVADLRFLRPLDTEMLLSLATSADCLLFVEEGAAGGFGSKALLQLLQDGALDTGRVTVRHITLIKKI